MTKKTEKSELDIKQIYVDLNNPRKKFDPDKLKELSEDIKVRGILQPIVVRPFQDKYKIVLGERRYRAACDAGLKTVPVVIRPMDDRQVLEAMLVENIQREDLEPLEEARAILELVKGGMKQSEVAQVLHKSRAWVNERLALLYSPEDVQAAIEAGVIAPSTAKLLKSVESSEGALKHVAESIKEKTEAGETIEGDAMKSILDEATKKGRDIQDLAPNDWESADYYNIASKFPDEYFDGDLNDTIPGEEMFDLLKDFAAEKVSESIFLMFTTEILPKCKKCKSYRQYKEGWEENEICLNDECFQKTHEMLIKKTAELVPTWIEEWKKQEKEEEEEKERGLLQYQWGQHKGTNKKSGEFPECKGCPDLRECTRDSAYKYACVKQSCYKSLTSKKARNEKKDAQVKYEQIRAEKVHPFINEFIGDINALRAILAYHLLAGSGEWGSTAAAVKKKTGGKVDMMKTCSGNASRGTAVADFLEKYRPEQVLRFALDEYLQPSRDMFSPEYYVDHRIEDFKTVMKAWRKSSKKDEGDDWESRILYPSLPPEPEKVDLFARYKHFRQTPKTVWVPGIFNKKTACEICGEIPDFKSDTPVDLKKGLGKRTAYLCLIHHDEMVRHLEGVNTQADKQSRRKTARADRERDDEKKLDTETFIEIKDKDGKLLQTKDYKDPISGNLYRAYDLFEDSPEGNARAKTKKAQLKKEGHFRIVKRKQGWVLYKRVQEEKKETYDPSQEVPKEVEA